MSDSPKGWTEPDVEDLRTLLRPLPSPEDAPAAHGYVTGVDTWFSGWGLCRGKQNVVLLPVESDREREAVAHNAKEYGLVQVREHQTLPRDAWQRTTLVTLISKEARTAAWFSVDELDELEHSEEGE